MTIFKKSIFINASKFRDSRVWPRRDGLSFGDLVFYEGAVALKESDRLSHRTNLTEGLR